MAKPSNQEEKQLLEQLRRHPDLFQRIKSIMSLADDPDHQIRTADELETLLVEEVRKLGKTTMESWGSQQEKQAAQEFKQQNPDARYGKKND